MAHLTVFSRRAALAIVAACAVNIAAPSASMPKRISRGETVEWVIPFREGGGSDKWGALLCAASVRNTAGQTHRRGQKHAGRRFNEGRQLVL